VRKYGGARSKGLKVKARRAEVGVRLLGTREQLATCPQTRRAEGAV